MLQNAYLIAKIGADTAENEQHFAEILPIGRRVADRSGLKRSGPPPAGRRRGGGGEAGSGRGTPTPAASTGVCSPAVGVTDTTADRQNFGKMLLVFGCTGTDFCK